MKIKKDGLCYKRLLNKLSKTIKSVKYTVLNKKMDSRQLYKYLVKIRIGIVKQLMRDTNLLLTRLTAKGKVETTISGVEIIRNSKLSIAEIVGYDISKFDNKSLENQLNEYITGLLETFVTFCKQKRPSSDSKVFVETILEAYEDLLLAHLSSCKEFQDPEESDDDSNFVILVKPWR